MGLDEFIAMLSPSKLSEASLQEYVQRALLTRTDRGLYFFTDEALELIADLFRVLLQTEIVVERLRIEIHQNEMFDLNRAYDAIDI